jgi:dipeptidase E
MQLHLFSSPGEAPIQDIIAACRPLLADQPRPVVAYLPAAAIGNLWIEVTEEAFRDLAAVHLIAAEKMAREEIMAVLDNASLLYIPGGNTFCLKQRLHERGLMAEIQTRVRNGLPLVAFSAGTVLCGHNILTTNDMNVCAATDFSGLNLTHFNFNVHYPADEGEERQNRDDRLWEYRQFHDNPVLALQDGAYVMVTEGRIELAHGVCWRFEPGQPRAGVEVGLIT